MPDTEQNNQKDFMMEKIKERPINKRRLFRRTMITAALAVVFGLIACLTFLLLEPVISKWLYPEEEAHIVQFPEDQEEMSPEQMLYDSMQEAKQEALQEAESGVKTENPVIEEDRIKEIVSDMTLDKESYRELYAALSAYTNELTRSMVTVTGISSETDWFHNVTESSDQSSGVVIANNGKQLLVMAYYSPIENADEITMTFHNNAQAEARLKQWDPATGLAILSVELSDLTKGQIETISIAKLGSSNVKAMEGTPIVALGRPMGIRDSVSYGIITSAASQQPMVDINYKILYTDIYGSKSADGVLFNMQGEIVGIITKNTGTDMKNILTAYGISEMKKIINKLSNGSPVTYLGITGVDVSREAYRELGVPYGAYVREIAMKSPAMMAGIQQGDVVVSLAGAKVSNFSEYTTLLQGLEAGQTVEVGVMRQSQSEYKEMSFTITLGEVGKDD